MPCVLSNSVYFKNLSPLVTEDVIREFLKPHLQSSDEIVKIEFRFFPNSVQRYCQVDFNRSAGVTATTALNGQNLLGVPIVATVIDPLSQAGSGAPAPLAPGLSSIVPQVPLVRPTSLSSTLPVLTPTFFSLKTTSSQYAEPEAQQISRTIHVTNIPEGWEIDRLIILLSAHVKQLHRLSLEVTDKKLFEGIVPELGKKDRIALIEFKTTEMADHCRKLPAFARFIDGKELMISQAKTTVSPREPDNVSFDLPPAAPVPVAYQQLSKLKLQEKIARARTLAQNILTPVVEKHKKGMREAEMNFLNSTKSEKESSMEHEMSTNRNKKSLSPQRREKSNSRHRRECSSSRHRRDRSSTQRRREKSVSRPGRTNSIDYRRRETSLYRRRPYEDTTRSRRREISPRTHGYGRSPERYRRDVYVERSYRDVSPNRRRRDFLMERRRREISAGRHRYDVSRERRRRDSSKERHRHDSSVNKHRKDSSVRRRELSNKASERSESVRSKVKSRSVSQKKSNSRLQHLQKITEQKDADAPLSEKSLPSEIPASSLSERKSTSAERLDRQSISLQSQNITASPRKGFESSPSRSPEKEKEKERKSSCNRKQSRSLRRKRKPRHDKRETSRDNSYESRSVERSIHREKRHESLRGLHHYVSPSERYSDRYIGRYGDRSWERSSRDHKLSSVTRRSYKPYDSRSPNYRHLSDYGSSPDYSYDHYRSRREPHRRTPSYYDRRGKEHSGHDHRSNYYGRYSDYSDKKRSASDERARRSKRKGSAEQRSYHARDRSVTYERSCPRKRSFSGRPSVFATRPVSSSSTHKQDIHLETNDSTVSAKRRKQEKNSRENSLECHNEVDRTNQDQIEKPKDENLSDNKPSAPSLVYPIDDFEAENKINDRMRELKEELRRTLKRQK